MRHALLALCIACAVPANADDCAARLAGLLASDPFANQPYETLTTTVIGGMTSIMVQKWASPRHVMMITQQPVGAPDILQYEGGTFSPDGAGGWTLLYQADIEQQLKDLGAMRAAMAAAVVHSACGVENRQGADFELVEGVLANIPPYEGDVTVSYLIDPAAGIPAYLDMAYAMSGIASEVTFAFTLRPGMQIPVP